MAETKNFKRNEKVYFQLSTGFWMSGYFKTQSNGSVSIDTSEYYDAIDRRDRIHVSGVFTQAEYEAKNAAETKSAEQKFAVNEIVYFQDSVGWHTGQIVSVIETPQGDETFYDYVVKSDDLPRWSKYQSKFREDDLVAEIPTTDEPQTETQSTTETERKNMNTKNELTKKQHEALESAIVKGEITNYPNEYYATSITKGMLQTLREKGFIRLTDIFFGRRLGLTQKGMDYAIAQGWIVVETPTVMNRNADADHAASAKAVSDEYSALIENRNVSDNWEQEEIDEQERNTAHASEPQPDSAQAVDVGTFANGDIVRVAKTGCYAKVTGIRHHDDDDGIEYNLYQVWELDNKEQFVIGEAGQYAYYHAYELVALTGHERPQHAATQTPAAHEDAVSDALNSVIALVVDQYDDNPLAIKANKAADKIGAELDAKDATIANLKTDLQTALTVLAETRVDRDSLRTELIAAWKYVDDIAPNKAAEKEAKKQLKKLGVKSTYS